MGWTDFADSARGSLADSAAGALVDLAASPIEDARIGDAAGAIGAACGGWTGVTDAGGVGAAPGAVDSAPATDRLRGPVSSVPREPRAHTDATTIMTVVTPAGAMNRLVTGPRRIAEAGLIAMPLSVVASAVGG